LKRLAVYFLIVACLFPLQACAKKPAPAPSLAALSCVNTSFSASGTDVCTVSLSSSSTGQTVSLASSSSSITVPSSLLIPKGSVSSSFTATVNAVSTATTVTLTASLNRVSKTVKITLTPAVVLTPILTLQSSNVQFGSVVDGSSATQTVTLSSTGTGPVTVSSVVLSGSTEFSFDTMGPTFVLLPNTSVPLNITFSPISTGVISGTITITSNSSVNPVATISLSGTGFHEVNLSWNEISPDDPIASFNVYRSLNGPYSIIGTSAQLNYTDTTVLSAQTYQYYVTAVDSSGVESGPSNILVVIIPN